MTGLALLLSTLTTGSALAGSTEVGTLYTAITSSDVQALLDSMMLTNTRAFNGEGGPAWQLTLGDTETVLFLDDCDGDRCGSVQLWAGFQPTGPVDLGTLNAWNRDHRFTRAYVVDSGVVHLESDLDLAGGVSIKAVVEHLRLFRASALAFHQHLTPEPAAP